MSDNDLDPLWTQRSSSSVSQTGASFLVKNDKPDRCERENPLRPEIRTFDPKLVFNTCCLISTLSEENKMGSHLPQVLNGYRVSVQCKSAQGGAVSQNFRRNGTDVVVRQPECLQVGIAGSVINEPIPKL